MLLLTSITPAFAQTTDFKTLDQLITDELDQGKIPGAYVWMLKNNETFLDKGYGFSDLEEKEPVGEKSIFELASLSKSFTAYGIGLLEKQGVINLQAPVSKYIKGLTFTYKGEKRDITVNQLLEHKSGIPFSSINRVKANDSEDALEVLVEDFKGYALAGEPGSEFEYATVNYDILGHLIETVSGMSYSQFMSTEVFGKLNMDQTSIGRANDEKLLAQGYQYSFGQPREKAVPAFYGNAPAGYVYSNGSDMKKWVAAIFKSLDASPADTYWQTLYQQFGESSDKDKKSYTKGWFYNKKERLIFHGGNNPTYSSFIIIDPVAESCVLVMANMNSSHTAVLAQKLSAYLKGDEVTRRISDQYVMVDKVAVAGIIISMVLSLFAIGKIVFRGWIFKQGKYRFKRPGIGSLIKISVVAILAVGIFYSTYILPEILMNGLMWDQFLYWVSDSVLYCQWSVGLLLTLSWVSWIQSMLLKSEDEKPYEVIALMGIVSAIGNACIIFSINSAVNGSTYSKSVLLGAGLVGIGCYIFGAKVSGNYLVRLTNDYVYQLRIRLVKKILNASYEEKEKIESSKIQTCLTTDTETISGLANVISRAMIDSVTVLCCFIFLLVVNPLVFAAAFLIIVMIAGLFFVAGNQSNQLWNHARTLQAVFFQQVNELIAGKKNLYLNTVVQEAFYSEINEKCGEYQQNRTKAALKMINVTILGELLFSSAILSLVFLVPVLINSVTNETLRSFVFILLYLTGPINGLLRIAPNLMQIQVAQNRVKSLEKQLTPRSSDIFEHVKAGEPLKLSLENVVFDYGSEEMTSFKVGPINTAFKSGEVVFVTGGNGSGKSTMINLITGLYKPHEGQVVVNGQAVLDAHYGHLFSTIFSDFHLFETLFGIDTEGKQSEIDQYLSELHMSEKVSIEGGKFSTTKLSTGQRKRLALLVSYLEDKPICVFDEWAADQDPEYRKVFYNEIIPALKASGKCVIAVTHDDAYFSVADRIIKLENGQIQTEIIESIDMIKVSQQTV